MEKHPEYGGCPDHGPNLTKYDEDIKGWRCLRCDWIDPKTRERLRKTDEEAIREGAPFLARRTPAAYIVVVLLSCIVIAISVWALFLLGDFLGVEWYVSAVAILLIGRFIFAMILDL